MRSRTSWGSSGFSMSTNTSASQNIKPDYSWIVEWLGRYGMEWVDLDVVQREMSSVYFIDHSSYERKSTVDLDWRGDTPHERRIYARLNSVAIEKLNSIRTDVRFMNKETNEPQPKEQQK
jgi:hypothetical protein